MSKTPLCEKPEYSESLFKAIAEQSGEGISLADAGGNFIFVNSVLCKMTGYGKTALLKMNARDLVPTDTELSLFPTAGVDFADKRPRHKNQNPCLNSQPHSYSVGCPRRC